MAVSKITTASMASVGSYAEQLLSFSGGKVYIANGSYASRSVFNTAFTSKTSMDTELSTSFDELSDLAEKAGKIESNVAKLKTKHYAVDGKRTNKISLNLAGISEERKEFIENYLNDSNKTIVLLDESGLKAMCFNGLRWSGSYSGEFDAVFENVIETEFSGSTVDKIWIKDDIDPAA